MIKDRQVDSGIPWAARRTLGSGLFIKDLSQHIVEYETVVNSFTTNTKRHVDNALNRWPATTNLAKTVAELSVLVDDVTEASKKGVSCTWGDVSPNLYTLSMTLSSRTSSWIPPSALRQKVWPWFYPFVALMVSRGTPRRDTFASFKEQLSLEESQPFFTPFVHLLDKSEGHCSGTASKGAGAG